MQELLTEFVNRQPLALRLRYSPRQQLVFLVQPKVEGGLSFRVVRTFAEVGELATHLLAPAAGGVRKEREVGTGLLELARSRACDRLCHWRHLVLAGSGGVIDARDHESRVSLLTPESLAGVKTGVKHFTRNRRKR